MTEPLTDAELDAAGHFSDRYGNGALLCFQCKSEWPCLNARAIAELRELRAEHAALIESKRLSDAGFASALKRAVENLNVVNEQNAALVGATAELRRGDGTYYLTQERAMAPGIADGWPDVIKAPHTKNGRLVKRKFASVKEGGA